MLCLCISGIPYITASGQEVGETFLSPISHARGVQRDKTQVLSLASGKGPWQGSSFERSCRSIRQAHGLGPPFHISLAARGVPWHKFWYCKTTLRAKEEKKKSQIVLMHQCAKCNSGHVSTRLRESAPVIINDLTGREVNV